MAQKTQAAPLTALERLAMLPTKQREAEIRKIGAEKLQKDWSLWARAGQLAPAHDAWRVWLLMAGRGFGKTRAGAEWVRSVAQANSSARIALIGASMAETRSIMVDGESGLLAIAPSDNRPKFEASRNRLVWKNGAQAFLYSGESPEGLRGSEHSHAWCDELAKWAYAQAAWDNLQLGLRLGEKPQVLITTTPKPLALFKQLMQDGALVLTKGATRDNPYLPERFVEAMAQTYGGTRMGRQELEGELLEAREGALWSYDALEQARVRHAPALTRVVVAVDPPAGHKGDACGIVAAGLGADGLAYVLEDTSVQGASPEAWARCVAQAVVRHKADKLVAEANQGGDMVAAVLKAAGLGLAVKLVHARRGKLLRAEPVAALYEAGRVRHVGAFPALEDELCGFTQAGYEGGRGQGGAVCGSMGGSKGSGAQRGRSPDRADALVYALSELMLGGAITSGESLRVRRL